MNRADRLVGSRSELLVRTCEKGGDGVGKTKCGKRTRLVDLVNSRGTPLRIHLVSAHRNEEKRIEPLLDQLQIADKVPEHLLYDEGRTGPPALSMSR